MNQLTPLIIKQTTILLANVEETLDALEEPQLTKEGSWKWPLGEQVYHFLHSLDQWFVNPYDYEEPAWLGEGQGASGGGLSKAELRAYYTSIRAKLTHYLETLGDQALSEFPPGCKFTRLELILGQSRHLMYHIGMIHGCLRSETGHSPEFIGLGVPVAPKRTYIP